MIRLQIAHTGTPVGERVVMFQSRYFEREFPQDNTAFELVELVDALQNDLLRMRQAMLAEPFIAGLFIGGMEGVEDEYGMFLNLQPGIPAFPIASTGARLKKPAGETSNKGDNPFDFIGYGSTGKKLSSIVKCYNPAQAENGMIGFLLTWRMPSKRR